MRRYLTFAVFCLSLPLATPAAEVKIIGSDLLRSALEKPLAGAKVDDGRVLRLRLDGASGRWTRSGPGGRTWRWWRLHPTRHHRRVLCA